MYMNTARNDISSEAKPMEIHANRFAKRFRFAPRL